MPQLSIPYGFPAAVILCRLRGREIGPAGVKTRLSRIAISFAIHMECMHQEQAKIVYAFMRELLSSSDSPEKVLRKAECASRVASSSRADWKAPR